jgi:hypothetical protein
MGLFFPAACTSEKTQISLQVSPWRGGVQSGWNTTKILVFLWPVGHWRQAKQRCGIIHTAVLRLGYLQPVLQLA